MLLIAISQSYSISAEAHLLSAPIASSSIIEAYDPYYRPSHHPSS